MPRLLPWSRDSKSFIRENAHNALSVVESAGNGVAKVAKAEDAQNGRSIVEPEPVWVGSFLWLK